MGVLRGQNGARSIASGALLIAILSLASRVLGVIRDRILASTFGAGELLDTYYAAFRIPDFLFNLLGLGALSAAFLPIYIRLRHGDANRAHRFASIVWSDSLLGLFIACVIGFFFARPIYELLTPGFSSPQIDQTVAFGRVMLFGTFLLGCSTTLGGILQAEERFLAFAGAPLAYNAGIIIGAVAFVPVLGPIGLAWGVVLGAALHAAIQWLAAARVGFHPVWGPSWRDPEIRHAARLMFPRTIGLAANHLQLLVLTAIASTLATGALATFTLAANIQMVPIALVGIAYGVAAFPQLSAAASAGDRERFRVHLSDAIRQIALVAAPAVVILLTLKAQVVRVLFGAGAFDWDDTIRTFRALEAFGYGLFAAMLIPLLTRAFYAFEDTRTPVRVSIIADVIVVFLALALGRGEGPRGLALAVSAGAVVQAALLLTALRRHTGTLDGGRMLTAFVKFGIAAIAMAVAIQSVKPVIANLTGTDTFVGIGLQGALAAILGSMVYIGVGMLLKSEEITALAHAFHRHALRAVRAPFVGADEARG